MSFLINVRSGSAAAIARDRDFIAEGFEHRFAALDGRRIIIDRQHAFHRVRYDSLVWRGSMSFRTCATDTGLITQPS